MQKAGMSERERRAARAAERLAGDGLGHEGFQDDRGALDDALVMELVSNAYWKWFERLISLDQTGTNVPAAFGAN
jgi:hypothetical protein